MLTLEVLYAAAVNWSLLRVGIPFVFELRAESVPADEARECWIELQVPGYLGIVRQLVPAASFASRLDLSGDLRPQLRFSWRPENAWRIGPTPQAATLVISVADQGSAVCPLIVLPPTYWHRALPPPGGGPPQIEARWARVAFDGPGRPPHFEAGLTSIRADLGGCPPVETAIAAFVDPNDPIARPGAEPGTIGHRLEDVIRIRSQAKPGDPASYEPIPVMEALEWILAHGGPSPVDYLTEFTPGSQAVRLLEEDRARGAVCLDLAVLGCELLESRGLRPVFLLTGGGTHSVLGVWTDAQGGFPDGSAVCRDPQVVDESLGNGALRLLRPGPSKVVPGAETEGAVGPGFVYAVDIAGCRRARVTPLPRPLGRAGAWIEAYLRRLLEELAVGTESSRLDDPDELFISMSCRLASGEIHPALSTSGGAGWLEETLLQGTSRAAVLGNGGAGKTYLARRFAAQLTSRRLSGQEGVPIPIFLPLRQLGRADSLLEALARRIPVPSAEDLRTIAADHRLLIVLDALDEAGRQYTSSEQYRALLDPVGELPNTSVLLTARPAMFPGPTGQFLPGFQLADLEGWSEDGGDLLQYLVACQQKGVGFVGGAGTFHGLILASTNLRDLARTPLFARMMVETREFIEAQGEIRDELDLYRRYTEACLGRRPPEISQMEPADAADATAETALLMYIRGRDALAASDLAAELAAHIRRKGIDAYRQFLAKDVLIHGLLAPDPTLREERHFRFTHVSIQHYFLAERLFESLVTSLSRRKLPALLAHDRLPPSVLGFLAHMFAQDAAEHPTRKPSCAPSLREALADILSAARPVTRPAWIDSDARVSLEVDVGTAFRNVVLLQAAGGRDLGGLDLSDLDLSAGHFVGVSLRGADLSGARLDGSNLRDADLRGCRLEGAHLCEVDVTGADFREAALQDCELRSLSVGHPGTRPRICGCQGLDSLLLDRGSRGAIELLLEAVATCEVEPEHRAWAAVARRQLLTALEELRGREPGRFGHV